MMYYSYLWRCESCDWYPCAYPTFVKSMLYSNYNINYTTSNSSLPTCLLRSLF